ncbi:MAG: HAD family hydrolase [Gammaproteobacteria bacterium]|nr:HAD family hydrolase [Gammaproteobacteria bacterium]
MDAPPVIFFDIDDTLLDYKTSQDLAALEFAKKYSTHIDNPEKFPKVWDEITARHMARYFSGELSFQEQRRCRIRESLGLDLSAQESDRVFDEYYQIYEESWRLFPDVESALLKLSGYSMAVITNGDKEHQSYKLKKLGVIGYFDDVITPACAGAPKPDLAIFQLAATRAGKARDECWYIGDNYRADYQGAKEAGYKSVWLNRHGSQEPCENQCKDLNEFVLKVLGDVTNSPATRYVSKA